MGQLTKVLNELEETYKRRDLIQSLLYKSTADWEIAGQYTEAIDECNLYLEHLWNQLDLITKKGTEVPLD